MKTQELLSRLEARNVELVVHGDRLRYRPARAVSGDLREELRAHKSELMELLRSERRRPLKEALPGGVSESDPSLLDAEVMAMSLDEFATAGLRVKVRPGVLGEMVIFASDNARVDPGERRLVYRAAEIRELMGLPPADIRSVHRVKKLFGGTIIPS